MEEMLCTGLVEDLNKLLDACNFSPEAFILTEEFPQYIIDDPQERRDLLHFTRLSAYKKDVHKTISGRVFASDFELRWEKEGNSNRVVYLGAPRDLPGLKPNEETQKILSKLDKRAAKKYYLFGEVLDESRIKQMKLEDTMSNDDNGSLYAEVRIPRLLSYPASANARRVRLCVCEYVEKATGSVQLFRFQGLEDEEGKP